MKKPIRLVPLTLLLAAVSLCLPNHGLVAQSAGAGAGAAPEEQTEETQETAPEAFVPTEKLPADAAVSFPIDI